MSEEEHPAHPYHAHHTHIEIPALEDDLKTKWEDQGPLPPADYYIYEEYEYMLEGNRFLENKDFTPVSRNAIEIAYKIFLERDLRSYLYTNYEPERNSYNDQKVDLICLTRRPPCFVILGKSGVGRTTLAARLAQKLNAIHINALNVLEYYKTREPEHGIDVKEILESGGTVDDMMILQLFDRRIKEMDVLHRGYVLDDFPLLVSEQVPIAQQMQILHSFVLVPDFAIVFYMQDVDLFKRRIDQKFDPETQHLYTKDQYEKIIQSDSEYKLNAKTSSSKSATLKTLSSVSDVTDMTKDISYHDSDVGGFQLYHAEKLDGSTDLPPISFAANVRLVSRLEDNSILVNDELEKFRDVSIVIQEFVDSLDKRKILEVNGYLLPSVIFKHVWSYLEGYGITPSPVPSQIIRPMRRILENFKSSDDIDMEFLGESCEPDDGDIDWEASYRAISVRGTLDPKFRWKLSRWKNLCPVALKLGKSIAGRPEFAVSFLNKSYFLSSQEAVDQFINNPRPFLLPEMPTSPIKFFVIGHPLAGKSMTAREIATLCDAEVVDMNKEIVRRYDQVKFDYLLRHKIQATFDAIRFVERENKLFWKRGERKRRMDMHDWIDKHLRGVAVSVIMQAVEDDDTRRKENKKLLEASYDHKLQDPYYIGSGACEDNRFRQGFSWEVFVAECREGKINWTHQERLELAIDLFKQGKLYFKTIFTTKKPEEFAGEEESSFHRDMEFLGEFGDQQDEDDEHSIDSGAFTDHSRSAADSDSAGAEAEEEDDEETLEDDGLTLLVAHPQKQKCKKKKRVKQAVISQDALNELSPSVSSILDANDELEESILLRFPMIPRELVEIVPMPDAVNEKHPIVDDIITRRMKITEESTNESEIYLEILRRGILEAESRYRMKKPGGPLTGGWVVDNLLPDIDKWRLILRTHDVAPDQVIVLVDHSPNYQNILNRLKRLYKKLHPKLKAISLTVDEFAGEAELPGEDAEIPGEVAQSGTDQDDSNYDNSSDLYDSMEPAGEYDLEEDSPSLAMLIERDARRQQSVAGSKCTSIEDLIKAVGISMKEGPNLVELYRTDLPGDAKSQEKVRADLKSGSAKEKRPNFEMGTYLTESAKNIQCEEPEKKKGDKEETENQTAPPPEDDNQEPKMPNTPVHLLAHPIAEAIIMANEREGELDDLFQERTPSGLLSLAEINMVCAEDADPEDRCVIEKKKEEEIRRTQPMSGKRRFVMEIRQFELFWNMVIPVLNEQEIRYWEMGVVDEDTVKEKVSIVLDELEGRFRDQPKDVTKEHLGDEEADAIESRRRWGDRVKTLRNYMHDAEDEEEEEDDDEESKSEGLIMEDTDPFATLENKPDIYRDASLSVESLRLFGDFKEYCPVTYLDKGLLRKGFPANSAKFKDHLYYFLNENCKARFMLHPHRYVPDKGKKKAPVPRICVTGSPGCGQEEIGLQMSKEYGICYISFRERLHELLKARFGLEVGPETTGVIIPIHRTLNMLARASSGDDMIVTNNTYGEDYATEEDYGESDYYADFKKYRPGSTHDVAIQSLGLVNTANVASNPISSIMRTENLARRKWRQLSKKEVQIKAFLENGTQLPESILDEFIASLWQEKPFTDVGFILVGFPNTEYDQEYLISRDLVPEHVYIMESNPLAIRNRLLIPTVDRWHIQNNPSGKRKVSDNTRGKAMPMASRTGTFRSRSAMSASSIKSNLGVFEYQREGRAEIQEFVQDTWTYTDEISKQISVALRHYHNIYSKDLTNLKKSLNRNRTEWTAIQTDLSVIAAKSSLTEKLHSILKYRSSIFEATVILNLHQADALLCGGVFELSKFRRWCPVEISKGNSAINMWYSKTVEKIPILHRRYVYFLAGKQHARHFRENVMEIIKGEPPNPAYPLSVVVLGTPKSGKTTVSQKLADYFGFTYISGASIVENILQHTSASDEAFKLASKTSSVPVKVAKVNPLSKPKEKPKKEAPTPFKSAQKMITADEVLCYLESGKEIPNFLLYRILDFALMDPKAQHHGVLFDDYPIDGQQLQDLLERGAIPAVVAKLNLDIKEAYERNMKKLTKIYDYEKPTVEIESHQFIEETTHLYNDKQVHAYDWFAHETQSLIDVNASQSPNKVFTQIRDRCIRVASLINNYTISIHNKKPVALEGTSPLTSEIPAKMSAVFGKFCPVALNDNDELISVENLADLSKIVEYDSKLFAFSSDEFVQKFVADPIRYLPPNCARVPPEDLPKRRCFTDKEFEDIQGFWGFMDFDPVMYDMSGFHPKALQRGNPKYAVEYREKFYIFTNDNNQDHFMKKPLRFSSVTLPAKLPRKFEPLDMEKISPYSYIAATGLLPELRKVINLLGTKRPRVPFMRNERCCALYMAYYFKTLNMNAPYNIRQKYREAMFQMMNHKMNTKELLRDLQEYYGSRLKKLPEKLKKSLDDFLELATKTDEEKVLIPTIRDLPFNYESIPHMGDVQLIQMVEDLIESAKKGSMIEREILFQSFCDSHRIPEDMTQRMKYN